MDELTKKRLLRTLLTQSIPVGHKLPSAKETTQANKNNSINCFNCKHFKITWEKNMPYACEAYGFKGVQIPSLTVKSSSGNNCQFFISKN